MQYFDSSAIAKLVLAENEAPQLREFVAAGTSVYLTSAIARTEVALAISRSSAKVADSLADTQRAMQLHGVTFRLVDVDPAVAAMAGDIGAEHGLRSLDAIHVATARAFVQRLDHVVTYDTRMATVCVALGLTVVSPGA